MSARPREARPSGPVALNALVQFRLGLRAPPVSRLVPEDVNATILLGVSPRSH